MAHRLNNLYDIGDIVYFNAPGGDESKIVNIIYNFLNRRCEYLTINSDGEKKWFDEIDITTEKSFKI